MAKNTVNANFNQIAVTDANDNVLGIRAAIGNVQITGGTAGQVIATNGSGVLSWTTASGGSAINSTVMGAVGSTAIDAGSVTFNTLLNSGYPWLSMASRYGVGTNYALYVNSRNLNAAGTAVYGGTYGTQRMTAGAASFLAGLYTNAGATFEIINGITGETWSVDMVSDQFGGGGYNKLTVQIPNPVNPTAMNSVIAALLTTNQTAFNAAAAGVAIEITAAEYAALVAGVPNTTKFGATDAIMATVPTSSNSSAYSGNFAHGAFTVETQAPAERYIYAFTTRVVTSTAGQSGNLYVHTSQYSGNATTSMIGQVHNNAIPISNATTQRYWVVKNAQYRKLACGSTDWVSVANYKHTGSVPGAYKYLSTTVPADGSLNNFTLNTVTTNSVYRPYIQLLAGTPT